jgi:hypothetical protein
MNIILDIKKFFLYNIFYYDTKDNIIMKGKFTKLLYSNYNFTMNGIYFFFPIDNYTIEKIMSKNILKFNPYSQNNLPKIQDFAKMEYRILEHYKYINNCNHKISNILSKQMYSGSIKIYKNTRLIKNDNINDNKIEKENIEFIVKISGIWETSDEIGLTYKLIQPSDKLEFL